MQQTIQISEQAPIPDHILQLAEKHQLGQVRTCYRRRLHRFLLWFLPFWLTFSIIILSYDGYMIFTSYSALQGQEIVSFFTSIEIKFWGDTAHLIFTMTILVLGILGVNPLWGFNKRLCVMDHGLLYVKGKKSEAIRWDEVEAIFWWKKLGGYSFR